MVPTRKSRKFPGLIIPLQLERVASPQLIQRREPPHTSPTAPTTCPTPSIPPASEAAPSSSALSRRPQLSPDHGLLRSQARYPRFPSVAESPRCQSAPETLRFPCALQCRLLASVLQCRPRPALQSPCRPRPALQSPCRLSPALQSTCWGISPRIFFWGGLPAMASHAPRSAMAS